MRRFSGWAHTANEYSPVRMPVVVSVLVLLCIVSWWGAEDDFYVSVPLVGLKSGVLWVPGVCLRLCVIGSVSVPYYYIHG